MRRSAKNNHRFRPLREQLLAES